MPENPLVYPNLLIVSGTGNKSGKTSIACRIIESFSDLSITAIKITPHFHETTEGLIIISECDGYSIYQETNRESGKDTSRMLRSGAARVYYAKVLENNLSEAFFRIMQNIDADTPVICESPALRNLVEPGIFIIMTSETNYNKKDIKHLQALPHLMIKLEDMNNSSSLPFVFEEGRWFLKPEAGRHYRRPG
jgi:hypothetical protein